MVWLLLKEGLFADHALEDTYLCSTGLVYENTRGQARMVKLVSHGRVPDLAANSAARYTPDDG